MALNLDQIFSAGNILLVSLITFIFFYGATIDRAVTRFSKKHGGKKLKGFLIVTIIIVLLSSLPLFIVGLIPNNTTKLIVSGVLIMFCFFKYNK